MTADPVFDEERTRTIARMTDDVELQTAAQRLLHKAAEARYSYHFDWLGLPIIQHPADIVAVQELLWSVRPRLVVETGVARGGSLALSASILELIGEDGIVVGIDIDIREPNRVAIESHPLAKRIRLIEHSSTDPLALADVREYARGRAPVVVLLDSDHTHEHVLEELQAYADLVTPGSYIVVFDTAIETSPNFPVPDRSWGPGNNPHTAVIEFLQSTDRFEMDEQLGGKLLLTASPTGYLLCVK